MTFGEYLSDHLGRLVLQVVLTVCIGLFLLVTGTKVGVLALCGIFWLLVTGCVLLVDFLGSRARLRELTAVMEGLDQKYLFAECVPGTGTVYERKLLELSRQAGKSMIRAVSDAQAAQREYREYVESWVHEIKAPITAAGLICRNVDPAVRQKLTGELARIEAHVERALFYARAESPEKDFVVGKACLKEIVAQALERHQSLLVQSGVRVETIDLEQTVYTDVKWVEFILGQLLQNAVRYRKEDLVLIIQARHLGRQVQLWIQDNGMGISSHELPRIFDRGYTGSNGRARGGSTGMGLYLVRRLADCLEIGLQADSREGEGTRVTITFPARESGKETRI